MNQLHVAIVEDDADDREFISDAFSSLSDKLTLTSFKSGTDFIDALNTHNCAFDLIVTDIRMPLVTGFEVIANIKENEKTKNIPVVVLSTSGNESDIEKAKHLGATAYYIKPFSLPEYCEITQRIMSSLNFTLVDTVREFISKINAALKMPEALVVPQRFSW